MEIPKKAYNDWRGGYLLLKDALDRLVRENINLKTRLNLLTNDDILAVQMDEDETYIPPVATPTILLSSMATRKIKTKTNSGEDEEAMEIDEDATISTSLPKMIRKDWKKAYQNIKAECERLEMENARLLVEESRLTHEKFIMDQSRMIYPFILQK